MRFSTLLLVALAALACVSSGAQAGRVHHLAQLASEAALGVDAKCLAGCAAKAALCVIDCKKGEVNFHLTCKEECALHAAECTAGCALKEEAPATVAEAAPEHGMEIIDSSNIEAAFAEMAEHEQWQSFKSTYGRSYPTAAHEAHRFTIFKANMAKAAELAKKNPEATFGVNKFADLHPLEFKRQYLNFRPAVGDAAILRKNVPVQQSKAGAVPASYDWRKPDQNRPVGVTAVKDQGQCGSCWAFSATEELESAWILSGKPAVALAPEQTVDCDTVDGGCNGGDTVSAYAYMKSAGVEAESSYPYTAGWSGNAGSCTYDKSKVVAKMTGFTYATPGCDDACTSQNEELLKQNLYNIAPVSICVDAEPWQTYTSGILTASSGCSSDYNELDHCVQLVGYGVDPSGKAFWSVRNSWATSWGEAGYIRLLYGKNTCGVADEATIVQV